MSRKNFSYKSMAITLEQPILLDMQVMKISNEIPRGYVHAKDSKRPF
uniref:Uncharacterized protein n=1 Tax=Rhizophora mucronata TaxID=61149 RepID=A0A2P2N0K8_RHIMU